MYGEFIEDGKRYMINTPYTPTEWTNLLFNDNYIAEISQTLKGKSSTVDAYAKKTFTSGYRCFYVLDRKSNNAYCPATAPMYDDAKNYKCIYGLGTVSLQNEKYGTRTQIDVFVPSKEPCEVWTVKISNITNDDMEISLFTAIPFENNGPMGGECRFERNGNFVYKYSFPYHVRYEDKIKVQNKKAFSYLYSDTVPHTTEGDGYEFFGCSDINVLPKAVRTGACSGIDGEGDFFLGAMEHRFSLKSGEEKTIRFIISTASTKEDIIEFTSKFDFDDEYNRMIGLWEKRINTVKIETPDKNLNYMVNYWVKKQTILLTRLNRMSVYCPVRNQLQDALGYSMIEPYEALEFALNVLRRQRYDGFLKQWYMTDGSQEKSLCLLNHGDAPIWLILCVSEIIEQCGDLSIYERKEKYIDSDNEESIYTHLVKAAKSLLNMRGEHGLCLMLDGDWTDPINGAGRLGKGESVWSSEASVYVMKRLAEIADKKQDLKTADFLRQEADNMTKALNTYCFDGSQYITGFDDNGEPFGKKSDKEAQIFVNSQVWAVIGGICKGDELTKLKESIQGMMTDFGPLLLKPAFSKWNDTWGRISIKQAGTTENGSVYCHAAMFKAYADTISGDGDEAVKTITSIFPTNPLNPPEKNKQLPLFIPNYYFGLDNSPNYGKSSCHYGTGSAAWLIWVVVKHILGFKKNFGDIHIEPVMPHNWEECTLFTENTTYKIKKSK